MIKADISYEQFMSSPVRRMSPELDFGVWWKITGFPLPFRVSWIDYTKELYAVDMRSETLLLLATGINREKVNLKMINWADLMYEPDSLIALFGEITDEI